MHNNCCEPTDNSKTLHYSCDLKPIIYYLKIKGGRYEGQMFTMDADDSDTDTVIDDDNTQSDILLDDLDDIADITADPS